MHARHIFRQVCIGQKHLSDVWWRGRESNRESSVSFVRACVRAVWWESGISPQTWPRAFCILFFGPGGLSLQPPRQQPSSFQRFSAPFPRSEAPQKRKQTTPGRRPLYCFVCLVLGLGEAQGRLLGAESALLVKVNLRLLETMAQVVVFLFPHTGGFSGARWEC